MAKCKIEEHHGTLHIYFVCPACNQEHSVPVIENNKTDGHWKWNGKVDNPTLEPSLRVSAGKYVEGADLSGYDTPELKEWLEKHSYICHFFIREGNIQYCSDCTHGWGGKTVPLPNNY